MSDFDRLLLMTNRFCHSRLIQLGLLMGLAVLVYYQALDSRFLLDDYVNLSDLGLVGEHGYSYFTFGGLTGNVGRPLSLLTFALQYKAWPGDPAAFKTVNLLIHLLNGILVYFLSRRLLRRLLPAGSRWATYSFFISALWLLHPIQLSTVVYTIQRMNLLASFFVLAGLLGYLYFRDRYDRGEVRKGIAGMSVSVGLGIMLGVLSKENAILLPLFVLLTEFITCPSIYRDPRWRLWAWAFLMLPLFLLAFYLSYRLGISLDAYHRRSFTVGERLLSQGPVLFDYISKIIAPRLGGYGLFHDDFTVSRGLFSPPVTALSWAFILSVIIAGIFARKRYPLIAFGVLWFFAGHILESSHLALELYFEHRNYLPLFGMCFIVTGIIDIFSKHIKWRVLVPAVLVYMCLTATISYLEADLWSKPMVQSIEWARKHPESKRAIQNLASAYMAANQYSQAKSTYERLAEMYPGDIYPELNFLAIKSCLRGKDYSREEWRELYARAAGARLHGPAFITTLDNLVKYKKRGLCDEVDNIDLMRLILILAANPEFNGYKSFLHELATVLAIEVGDPGSALANIDEAIKHRDSIELYILKIKILLALNNSLEAGEVLQILKERMRNKPLTYLVYRKQMEEFSNRIKEMKH